MSGKLEIRNRNSKQMPMAKFKSFTLVRFEPGNFDLGFCFGFRYWNFGFIQLGKYPWLRRNLSALAAAAKKARAT